MRFHQVPLENAGRVRSLDFVPFEEVVLIFAWALGAAQAADHQDRHSGSHHQRHQTSARHNPMPHIFVIRRLAVHYLRPQIAMESGPLPEKVPSVLKCTIGKFGPASSKFVVGESKILLAEWRIKDENYDGIEFGIQKCLLR